MQWFWKKNVMEITKELWIPLASRRIMDPSLPTNTLSNQLQKQILLRISHISLIKWISKRPEIFGFFGSSILPSPQKGTDIGTVCPIQRFFKHILYGHNNFTFWHKINRLSALHFFTMFNGCWLVKLVVLNMDMLCRWLLILCSIRVHTFIWVRTGTDNLC